MLIEFRAANFRSLNEAQTLSLVAGSASELAVENTIESGLPGFPRLLRSAVIYGANAAGKTNLLRALQFMQRLVLTSATASQPGNRIGHPPFRLSEATKNKPGEFEVVFVDGGVRYEYGFSVDAERIHDEWLIAYPHGRPQNWFERTYNANQKEYEWHFSTKLKGSPRVWRDATRENALFLSTAIQLNSEQLRPIFEWFQKKLVMIFGNELGESQLNPMLTHQLLEQPDGKQKLLQFVHAADLGIDDLTIQRIPLAPAVVMEGNLAREPQPPTLVRVTSFHKAIDSGTPVPLDFGEESKGTRILIDSAGAWLNVLKNGEVILYDELDTSLHPLMTRFLIRLFHGQATNPNNAQLIFTTHDTSLLDPDLFRRDQVWFVEKDEKSASRVYPLSDFSPRKDEALERGYLKGRYGALPFIGELKL